MKPSLLAAFTVLFLVWMPAHAYDTSEKIIDSSHLRSKYFEKPAFFDSGMNYDEFIAKADKKRGVVVHSHGCSGVKSDDYTLKNFYAELGYYFVLLDFHKRGDASPSCTVSGGVLVYHDLMARRLSVRILELKNHVDKLRQEGFDRIFITGHSEGGMVVQGFSDDIDGAIIHSMLCMPYATSYNNVKNRYLHLVSLNDPAIAGRGAPHTCHDRPNYMTVTSRVASHAPLADASWRDKIRDFLGAKN